MKVAIVVQRFGEDIIGGAESHSYQLALRLKEALGWSVHVYTTTAFSYQTWSHFYPEGEEDIKGLKVFRYKSRMSRWPTVFRIYHKLVAPTLALWGRHPRKIPSIFNPFLKLLETLWYILQGPWCPKLVKSIIEKKNEYDTFIFFTYLYYPTVFSFSALKEKSILVPLAHKEPPLYFPRVRKMLKESKVLFANSEVERLLLLRRNLSKKELVHVVGCGINESFFKSPKTFPVLNIPGLRPPYITYLGRISKGKGISLLIQHFLQFILDTKDEDLTLVLAGENDGSINIFYHPQIKFIGYISQEDKTSLIAHSAAVVNPSPKESLSLLALEAIALQKPALVNAKCDVLKYYAIELATVFDFSSYEEFKEHLVRILHIRKLPDFKTELRESQEWVHKRYSWEKVIEDYRVKISEYPTNVDKVGL